MCLDLCEHEQPTPVGHLLTEMHSEYQTRTLCCERMFRVVHKRIRNSHAFILQNSTVFASTANEALSLALGRAGLASLKLIESTWNFATAEHRAPNGLGEVWSAVPA